MIKRHLTEEQSKALTLLNDMGSILLCSASGPDVRSTAFRFLIREKLAVRNERAAYVITEAGKAALASGLYEKQPHVLIMPVTAKKIDDGRHAHLTYTGPEKSA